MSLAVVTGATGHVGGNLVRVLLANGRRVRCLVREDVRTLEGLDVQHATGDILDQVSLVHAFAGADTVFHAAARISILGGEGGRVEQANVHGTQNVVAACLGAGVKRLVHFSSIHALDDPGDGSLVDERASPADTGRHPAYDRSKAAGEREVLAAQGRGMDVVVLNPTGVIGPHDIKPSAMGRVILQLARGRMPAVVGGGFNWVDARDVAVGAVAAERLGRTGERYVLSGTWASVAEVGRLVAAETGTHGPRLSVPLAIARSAALPAELATRAFGAAPVFTRESLRALSLHGHLSHARAERELGWRPRPLAVTIADTIAWFRATGKL